MVLTRKDLEPVLAEEFGLVWRLDDQEPLQAHYKRDLINGYIGDWGLPQLVAFARRVATDGTTDDAHQADLRRYIDAYDRGGGVKAPAKNLIVAAIGPKPEDVWEQPWEQG